MNKILNYTSLGTDTSSLLLRLIVGGLMLTHGYPKLTGYAQYVTQFPDLVGLGSQLSLILVIFAEFVCAILVLIGFFTRLAIIPIFITMFVAFFIAHAQDPLATKELALVFLILSVVIFILGSGKYSLDFQFTKKRV